MTIYDKLKNKHYIYLICIIEWSNVKEVSTKKDTSKKVFLVYLLYYIKHCKVCQKAFLSLHTVSNKAV